ncbi:DNA mismatch repair protein [Diaporthe australafricana]|uniref:DNA mismatch repair protein n=1 Tax=Diaporthe australafricana TaxID=127596 RepID=A0ABR3WM38_9PEZI
MSIKPLPADVVAQIKSSVVITSLNNVICGLIENSLDAEATRVNLSVDYSRGNCSVEDNGTGIQPSEFQTDGGLGRLHYGFVCREPVATKRVQFISIGIEPLSNESRCNILFEEVNKVFADSAFGAVDAVNGSDGSRKRKMDSFTDAELKLRKGVDRWPMFFLKISTTASPINKSPDVNDVLDDRQPKLALITDLLKAMFYEFLQKSHCRPKTIDLSARNGNGHNGSIERSSKKPKEETRSRTVPSGAPSPMERPARKTPRLEASDSWSESPFDGWSRVKSGQTLPTFKESTHTSSHPQSPSLDSATKSQIVRRVSKFERSETDAAEPSRPPLYDANGKTTRKPFDDIDPKQLRSRGSDLVTTRRREAAEGSRPPHQLSQDQPLQWINPATNLATLIDPRTGFSLPPKPLTLSRRTSEQHNKGDKMDLNSAVPTSNATSWAQELVEKWKNPVFEPTERPIPKLSDVSDMLGIDAKPGGHHCNHEQPFNMGSYHEKSALGLRGRMSKNALRRAELINQVDNKFILVKVPLNQMSGAAWKV